MKLCKTGFHFLLFGGSAWLFWWLLSYYGLPDGFERDAVRTMFTIWKWVAIGEMVGGALCFFEAGRSWLVDNRAPWCYGKDKAETDAGANNDWIYGAVVAAILHAAIFFCLVLILAHWIWFVVFLVTGFIVCAASAADKQKHT